MMQDFVNWVSASGQWNDGILVLGAFIVFGVGYLILQKG